MLDVLVTAVLRLSHAALGPMAERGRGGVINVSSVAAFLPRGTYSAAKAWVNSFSEWAHNEYKPQGVTVMALCPGFTKTEFHERMQVKRGDNFMWLDVEFLVRTALADFDKGRTFSVPGAQYKTVVALTRAVPEQRAAAVPVDGSQVATSGEYAGRRPSAGARRPRAARSSRRSYSSGAVVLQPRSWSILPVPWWSLDPVTTRSRLRAIARSSSRASGAVVLVVDLDADQALVAQRRPASPRGARRTCRDPTDARSRRRRRRPSPARSPPTAARRSG